MLTDVFFVLGCALGGLAIIAFLSANVERSLSRAGIVLALLAIACVIFAEVRSGIAYGPASLPFATIRIVGHVVN